jgi:UDP-N-acetylmuramoyl-tripeptide--D-alanyl-D-alanine ligase
MKTHLKKTLTYILYILAKLVLRRYKPSIVGVTGNVGKTSTKDAIFVAMSPHVHIRKSEKSFNSEIGVPLSVLGVPNAWNSPIKWAKNIFTGIFLIIFKHSYPKWLVLEIGADAPGDIKSLSNWIKPDVVVITRFPDVPVHVEFFESKEAVIEEKKYLVKALKKDGVLILNADDPEVLKLSGESIQKVVTYGFTKDANVRVLSYDFIYQEIDKVKFPIGLEATIAIGEKEYPMTLEGILGAHQLSSILAGIAVAYALSYDVEKTIEALKEFETPPGRLSPILGINNSLIIDDSYNSSPVAVEASLSMLKKMKAKGKKIAVLGDMLELGKYTADSHRDIGVSASLSADIIIAVGIRSKMIHDTAFAHGFNKEHIYHVSDSIEASEILKNIVAKGDIVLVKGSQGVRLEKAVKAIMRFPEEAKERLVRQDPEWQRR